MTSPQLLAPLEPFAASELAELAVQTRRAAPARRTERKYATVMFVDIQGSMSLSRRLELEDWCSLIDELYELMCESVYASGGWVGEFTGDGIKGIFEASEAREHAFDACLAALRLRAAIRVRANTFFREHGLELRVRTGINSGEVVTGSIGDRFMRCHTVNGYSVSLAKRIEALAPPDRIYMTADTAAAVASVLEVRDVGAFEVKGADAPVDVFELVGTDL
jgi:class 3 adenylate cyclase